MFVSNFSSYLFYLYVSAAVQLKNCLARYKSFLAIPNMLGVAYLLRILCLFKPLATYHTTQTHINHVVLSS
jgi:hypothetical protein